MPMIRRSEKARNPFVVAGNLLLTVLFLATIAGGIAFVVGKQRFEAPGPLTEERVVNIPRGGVRDTAAVLARHGVIDEPWLFIAGALTMNARDRLRYGEYRFPAGASIEDVIETMMSGRVVQHAFTVPEGLTSEQIVARLVEDPVLVGAIEEMPREGTLLPETYRFTRGTTRQAIIERMQGAQQQLVQQLWERRSPELPVSSPQELVTLASIIEKETGKPQERTRVAAVFINRLRRKMRLQSDPTIIYGLVGGKGSLGRGIQASEIRQATPYNTYVIDGLPPGPIANPGRASLEAVINPARTRELYFVADGTGGHAFSESYDQHKAHVQKLRGREKAAATEAAAETEATDPSEPETTATPKAPAESKPSGKPTVSVMPPERPGRRATP